MKFAYISTVSEGYLFAVNATMNAAHYYGTNADFHLLYRAVSDEYRERSKDAFPFKIVWSPLKESGPNWHNAKYGYVKKIKDDYDAVCLIDGDLFICCNTNEYFERAAKEDVLITATHRWSGGVVDHLFWDDPNRIADRGHCQLADFPVFLHPSRHADFFELWFKEGELMLDERTHPLIAFNRSVCKTFKPEQIIPLHGDYWVCDRNYWEVDYVVKDDKMYGAEGKRVYAIHNKWWKIGRANGDFRAHQWVRPENKETIVRLRRGERNMNTIKDFMDRFNQMNEKTRVDAHYLKERIDMDAIIKL